MNKEIITVSFSGGRTSAYMCWWLKNNMSWLYDFKFMYANTGQEHPKTLEFINKVDKYLKLDLVWLEAVVYHGKRKSSGHTIVSYETADRTGKVFEEVIKKYGLPRLGTMHCTRELKINTMKSWKKSIGLGSARSAIGIRYDEFNRVSNDKQIIYPLATIAKITKQDVIEFWKNQPFDLEISEEQGNCWWCYKKSEKKLALIAKQNPEAFNWISGMIVKYPEDAGPGIFRNHKTVKDILSLANKNGLSEIEDCAEECGTIIPKEV